MKKIIFSFISLSCITSFANATGSNSYNVPAHASLSTGTYIEEIDPLSFGTIGYPNDYKGNADDVLIDINYRNGNLNNPSGAQVSGYNRGKIRIYAPAGTHIEGIGSGGTTSHTLSADGKQWFIIVPALPALAEISDVPSTGYIDIVYGGSLFPGPQFLEGSTNGAWIRSWSAVPKNQTHTATMNLTINY